MPLVQVAACTTPACANAAAFATATAAVLVMIGVAVVVVVAVGSSHLQLGMSGEPLHGTGFFGTYPGACVACEVAALFRRCTL